MLSCLVACKEPINQPPKPLTLNLKTSKKMLLPLSLLQSLLLVMSQVLLKYALQQMAPFGWTARFFRSVAVNWRFALCGLCFATAGVLWTYIVKHYPLSVAYPLLSLSYAMGMVAAVVFFHETVEWYKWLGVLLIMTGCILIAR